VKFSFDPLVLTAFALTLVRATAWLFVSPPFNTRMIPITVKVGVSASLALAAAPIVAKQPLPVETTDFLGALLTQALVGFALGF